MHVLPCKVLKVVWDNLNLVPPACRFCILCPAVDLFHFQSRPLRRLVLHTLAVYAVSGFLSVTDMIASGVYWDV